MLANSEDSDQTSVGSDLGLHCLPMCQKEDTRLICVYVMVCAFVFSFYKYKLSKLNFTLLLMISFTC